MIGNDIVDLQYTQAESNWKRPRFLDKVFTEEERQYILEAENPEVTVWLLWSMKESVYKIVSRQEKRRFFAPRKLESSPSVPLRLCANANAQRGKEISADTPPCVKESASEKGAGGMTLQGTVTYQNKTFHTQTHLTQDFIHTTAHYSISNYSLFPDQNAPMFDRNIFHLSQTNPHFQSQFVRTQLLTFYAQKRNLPLESLSIEKDSTGIPYIYFQNQPQPATISLSHHGNYGGFAIYLHHDE